LPRSRTVPFPFCQITLRAEKPLKDRYSKALYRRHLQAIGAQIRQKRQKSGLTQPELAQKLGVRVETIQNWESGRTIPPLAYLPGLAEFLGCSPLETAYE